MHFDEVVNFELFIIFVVTFIILCGLYCIVFVIVSSLNHHF